MLDHQLLQQIPKVDEILRMPVLTGLSVPRQLLLESIRAVLDSLRSALLSGQADTVPPVEDIAADVRKEVQKKECFSLRNVINATGVVLHTNLGRAPLSDAAAEAVSQAAAGYSTLEYDLQTGSRGSRYSHVEPLLTALTGAEAAVVVNNNAAAVLLILSALGKGREAVVSRGELVEIGGSFRVPDIMEACGCILREVGTTNKTHLSDYEKAIGENTFALMKVHTSNFRITGFTESVALEQLAVLAHAHQLPLIEDLGSGALCPPERIGIPDEPWVTASMKAGADIVSFSGDKLLGGPQAGIIIGRKKYIDLLKAHPLMRAMRVDKLTLAALEATLRVYLYGVPEQEIPTLAMLCVPPETLKVRALLLSDKLRTLGVEAEAVPLTGQVGGGSAPAVQLSGWGAAVTQDFCSPNELCDRLRSADPPVIARVDNDRVCLDVRTMFDTDFEAAAAAVAEALA